MLPCMLGARAAGVLTFPFAAVWVGWVAWATHGSGARGVSFTALAAWGGLGWIVEVAHRVCGVSGGGVSGWGVCLLSEIRLSGSVYLG